MSRLKEKYQKEVVPALKKEFGYANIMAIPKVTQGGHQHGARRGDQSNAKIVDTAADELSKITGQKAAVRRAKKSIAAFKVRQGMPVGAMVTLRGERMYEFLDRLIEHRPAARARLQGHLAKGFDGRGNYTLGLRDQIIFPEIDYMKVDKARGMNVSVVTTREDRRGGPQAAAAHRAAVQEQLIDGDHGQDCEGSEDAQVQDPPAQPLQAVRPPAGLHAQVRAVPALLPQGGARGRCHGRDEEQLVAKWTRPVRSGRTARMRIDVHLRS